MPISFNDDVVAEKFFKMAEDVSTIKVNVETLKETVGKTRELTEKHETAYKVGKLAAVPALAAFHIGFRHILNKLGI